LILSGLGQARNVGQLLATVGGKYVVLIDGAYRDLQTGAQPASSALDGDGWKRLVDTTNKLGGLIRDEFGLELTFHPHADTHVEYAEQIENLLGQTDPKSVGICLDFGHIEYRGGDSIGMLRKHRDRIKYLHLKTVDADVRKRVLAENPPFATAVAMGIFCEPPHGTVNFKALSSILEETNYDGWATVEQDLYPCPFDKPLPIAKRTREYLQLLGMG